MLDFVKQIVADDRRCYRGPDCVRSKGSRRFQLPVRSRRRDEMDVRMVHVRLDLSDVYAGLK